MMSRELPIDSVTWWRHSKAAGDSAIGGQATLTPGRSVKPAAASSSTSKLEGHGAGVHAVDHVARHDVDGEGERVADVAAGVLGATVRAKLDAERKDRRIGRQAVEGKW